MPDLWPSNQAESDRYAAALAGRLSRFQLHVEPDWLFGLCRDCGFSVEQNPPTAVSDFRFAVASHVCLPAPGPALDPLELF